MRYFAAPLAVAAGIGSVCLFTALPAQAVTVGCATLDGGFCGGQTTVQATPAAMTVNGPAGNAKPGTELVGTTPADSQRQDFDQRNPLNPVNNDKVFKFAPRGALTNLCVTDVGGVGSVVVLERCNGGENQRWQPVEQDTGFNWINDATGLALTNVNGTLRVRPDGLGTATDKRWVFAS